MNRGVDHRQVFFADVDRVELGRRLAAIHADHQVTTLAYCLMDNHFHLLLHAPPGQLSAAMQHLVSVYTRHTNDRLGRDGPLFRGRFHSIPVETDAYLLTAARYIHRNPLARPDVASPRDYRWSSYRAYLGLRPPPPFLDMDPVTSLLGGPGRPVAAFTEDDNGPPACAHPMLVEDVRLIVECAIAVDDLEHAGEEAIGAPTARTARTVMALLADRSPDPGIRRIVLAGLGHSSTDAAGQAIRRARRRHDADPMVRRVLARAEAQLLPPHVARHATDVQMGSDPI